MQTFHRDFSLQRCLLVGSFLAMASASASTLIGSAGDPDLDEVGELSGWVEARTVCPHLHQLHCALQHRLPVFDTPCQRCDDLQENWTCLSCCEVYCGRYINGHMLWHHQSTLHPMAISFRDLSVWCFLCDSYLDARLINELLPAFETLHVMKFGEVPPRLQFEMAESSGQPDSQAALPS
eukprot:c22700_g1_i2 orf=230-769(+)